MASGGSKQFNKQKTKETLDMLALLQRKIKNGTMRVKSSGYWRGVTQGKYTFRVDVEHLPEIEKESDQSE